MYNECRHIKTNGVRCHSPALSGHAYCFFHAKLHGGLKSGNAAPKQPIQFPPLEDRRAVQISVSQVIDAIASSRIDHRTATLLLYAIQIGVQAIPRQEKDDDDSETVREVCSEQNGELIAPENEKCEPAFDCDACARKEDCIHPDLINYRSVKRIFTRYKKGHDFMDQKDRDREAKYRP